MAILVATTQYIVHMTYVCIVCTYMPVRGPALPEHQWRIASCGVWCLQTFWADTVLAMWNVHLAGNSCRIKFS